MPTLPSRIQRSSCLWPWVAMLLPMSLVACGRAPEHVAIRLVDLFTADLVTGSAASSAPPTAPTVFRFDEPSAESDSPTHGWDAVTGVRGLDARDGLLVGRTTDEYPIIHFERTMGLDSPDQLHSIEVRMRASAGANLFIETDGREGFEPEMVSSLLRTFRWEITTPIIAGDEMRTYTLTKPRPLPASGIRHLYIRPSDEAEAEFAIESVRLIFRKEYLAGIESGIGWQGMSEIYRESLVARSPETIELPMRVPADAWLDIALGTVDDPPVTFQVTANGRSGARVLLRQTLTTPYRWQRRAIDLTDFARQEVTLSLELSGEYDGAIGVWGAPVVRTNRVSPRRQVEPSVPIAAAPPQGVIVIWADTLRRDHLDAYGYDRETAPTLRRLAAEGVRFERNVSQATWTKVSTPAMMTSLYPSSNGVRDFPDHLPASATTMAEVYRDAGYATLSLASNLFTGQFTNLHQGFEELHEDGSLPDQGSSKTSREYVDRLSDWLETHQGTPFFVFMHLYDPHDPFEPRPPYDTLWADAAKKEEQERHLNEVREVIEDPMARLFGMPSRGELEKAGIDADAYVEFDQDWYDGSIRGMDAEIGRLLELLERLGIDGRTLIVFMADHGEEFLEHGRTFHGQTVYGELTQVPLLLRWPDGVAAGTSVDATVRSIDLMPTLLEISGLPAPDGMQGQSLLPLLVGGDAAGGWQPRPAVSEKAQTVPGSGAPWPADTESYAIVDGGWKLIHNVARHDGVPEYELYDAVHDPLDRVDLAAENPDVVGRLAKALEGWQSMVAAARLTSDAETAEGLSQEQLQRLRSLGYIR